MIGVIVGVFGWLGGIGLMFVVVVVGVVIGLFLLCELMGWC